MLVGALFWLGFPAIAQDAGHRSLLAEAKSEEGAVVRSLEAMVAIESGSEDRSGLARMSAYVEQRLIALGMTTQHRKASGAAGDVIVGTSQGDGRLNVMLIAHLDTVYAAGILITEPFRREGNKLFGPGIADDKGGVAVILHSLEILRRVGWHNYATLTVVFNPDEEIGSVGSGLSIAALGGEQDVVLSFEPCPSKEMAGAEGVLLGAAGTASVTMVVDGKASHAGSAPDQGRNALVELAFQILRTVDIAKGDPRVQLNWTTVSSGLKRNQIPARAEAGADVRILDVAAGDALRMALEARVKEQSKVPDTTTTIRFDAGRPPFVGGARGQALAERAQRIYAELDNRKLMLHRSTFGGTDAGFAQQSGTPAVLESLGLAGWGYHASNEYVEVDSIAPRLYLTTRLLQELGRNVYARAP